MNKNKEMTVEKAWEILLEKYDIVRKIKKEGIFHIEASQIKEFKEPRLMSKWDSFEQLPSILKKHGINILSNSRRSYVLSDFLLYKEIPALEEHVMKMTTMQLPEYKSINVDTITSEANAINVLILSNILDDFLETDNNVSTFSGRMGTGTFSFMVDTFRGKKQQITVSNAQCEIDGGFENSESIVIMEAKNVVHSDFHVRQLYYPYRLWKTKVDCPIRLVLSIYSNKIYRLFEYEFIDIHNYSSIKLVRNKNYSLQNTKITLDELLNVRKNTIVKYDDNQTDKSIAPFIQADSFERVISLLEHLFEHPMNDEEIAKLMQFGCNLNDGKPQYRQSQYYYNAGKYLGLFDKTSDDKKEVRTILTKLGREIYKMKYKERQLKLVSLILEHQIFSEFFDIVVKNVGEFPDKEVIQVRMRKLNVCNEPQIVRRSTSVKGWLKWMFNLNKL